jgi:LacI family transcriptional regulator
LKTRRPTIFDVARRARVAVGTVSNVLNQSRQVGEARRERVLSAIQELGYLPNGMAQGLRRKRSRIVGLCVPHTTSAYLAALIDTFEEIAAHRGYEIMQVLSHNDSASELRRVRALLQHRVGGFILVPCPQPQATFELLGNSGVPTVIVDRPASDPRFDQVSIDNRAAMEDAVRQLIALGHRSILFVVRYPKLVLTRHRIDGLSRAARKAAEPTDVEVIALGNSPSLPERFAAAVQGPQPPTVIIVNNSTMATMVIRSLRDLGIRYPDDLSLLVFDEPEWADLLTPELSIVRHPTREIARRAWELLINRMSDNAGEAQWVTLPASVELRASVGPPARKPAKPSTPKVQGAPRAQRMSASAPR